MKLGRAVEAKWDDHSLTFGDAKHTIAKVKTLGYFVEETPEFVVIALSMVEGVPHDKQLIDKRMLRSLKKV